MLDVGEEQLLVLLLVVQAEFEQGAISSQVSPPASAISRAMASST